GASVRAVAWNHLLDFAPDLPLETPQRRHIVQRFLGGVAWAGRGAQATLALIHVTREFVGQRTGANFGSVTLHLTFCEPPACSLASSTASASAWRSRRWRCSRCRCSP